MNAPLPARRAFSHRKTAAAENKDNSMQFLQEDTAKRPVLATTDGSFSVISTDVWAGPVYPRLSWKEWVSQRRFIFSISATQCVKISLSDFCKYLFF